MLEIQDQNTSSDVVAVDNGVTILYTALIPVDQLITSAAVLATHKNRVTMRNDQTIGTVCMIY